MCITLNFLQFHSTPTELQNSPVSKEPNRGETSVEFNNPLKVS